MQIVFQDPSGSLNPAMTVGDVIGEGLALHRLCKPGDRAARVAVLLDRVGLPRAAAARYPRELSGGQRQRVGIARALSVEPSLIVADEAVSALDVSVQAQIVNLLQDLQAELGLAILFIGHDLGLVHHLCARVTVLYLGKVMETAPAEALQARPRHPYTRALLDAQPRPDPGARREAVALTGEPPSPISPPSGCVFRTRCRHALASCAEIVPALEPSGPDHLTACIRQFEIDPYRRSSVAALSPSPIRFTAAMVTKIRTPGGAASQGELTSQGAALFSRPPQVGIGGWTPKPRKDRADSSMIDPPTARVADTTMGPSMFGRMWRRISRPGPAPRARAAVT